MRIAVNPYVMLHIRYHSGTDGSVCSKREAYECELHEHDGAEPILMTDPAPLMYEERIAHRLFRADTEICP